MTALRPASASRSRLQVPLWAALALTVAPALLLGALLLRDVFAVQREIAAIGRLTALDREAVTFGVALRTSQVVIRDYARGPTPALRDRLRAVTAEVRSRGAALARDGEADSTRTAVWTRLLTRRLDLLDSTVAMPPAEVGAWFAARAPGGTVDAMLAIVALDGRLVQVNAALCDMLGYTAEELVGRTYGEITHPDDLAGDDALAAQLAAGAIPRYEYEKRYLAKDGSPVPIMLHGSAVRRGDGTLEHFIAQIVDLRAQKAAQAASLNRKAELRSILDGSEDVVFRYDIQGRVTYVNPTAVRVTGRSAEDLVGRPLEELTVPPSLVPRWRETIRAVVERGEGRRFEFDYPAPDGTTRFFSVRMTPIRNLSGTITGVVEFSRDLTVLREAEQALREREAEFTALVESADDIIVRYDRSLTIRFTNPAATAATGIPADAMLGRHVRDIGLPPALETRWVEALEAVLRTGAPQALDYSFPDASGGLRHYQTRFTAGRGPDGTVESVYAISRDTTSLVQVSEELATREAELRSIVETTEDLVYRYDTDGRVRYVNPSVTRASGRPIGSYVGRTAREIIGDSPLTRRVHETLMRVVATGEAETMEYTMHRPTDASEHFYHSRFTAERTVDGRIIGVVALSRDITERRRIELERERLLDEVTRAQAAVKTLKGLLPTCAWCHRIKDDQGHWEQMEAYIARRTDAEFSHGLCPDCATKMMTEG